MDISEQYIPLYDVLCCTLYDWQQQNSVMKKATTYEVPTGGRSYFIGMLTGCKGFSIDLELCCKVSGKDHWGLYGSILNIESNETLCLKPFYMHKMDKLRLQLIGSGNPVLVAKLCETLDSLQRERPMEIGFINMTFPKDAS